MSEAKTTYSHHHFFWPFRWDVLPKDFLVTGKKETVAFGERTNIGKFETCLVKDGFWKRELFVIKESSDYNEFTYFLSFVRKSLYDSDVTSNLGYETMRYFEYQGSKETDTYKIDCLVDDGKDEHDKPKYKDFTVSLKVEGITLHIFKTGIGILSFDLANQEKEDQASILVINDVGRRVYPQFLDADGTIDRPQKAFLAKSITLRLKDKQPLIENFISYNLSERKISVTNTFLQPAFIEGLFDTGKFLFHITENLSEEKILLSRVADDRMFFLCWYGNTGFTKSPSVRCFKNWDWWYAFVFGDKTPKSIGNTAMQEEQLLRHTYARFSEWGTLYGMSRDSFVGLSPAINDMIEKEIPRIDIQMNTMYYQMAVLCLVQRASILKFSAEIANLSDKPDENATKNLIMQTKNIYWNYLQFKNKVYFREVTSQIQGIEMYSQFQHVMNIPTEVEILENKIEALHNYLNMKEAEMNLKASDKMSQTANDMNKDMHKLTWMAGVFLPITTLLSIFGLSTLGSENLSLENIQKFKPHWPFLISLVVVASLSAISIWIIIKWMKKSKENETADN